MSDKFTDIVAYDGDRHVGGLGEWGHVSYADAVELLRRYAEHERDSANGILAAIERGEVRVFQQLGPWAAKNRREIKSNNVPAAAAGGLRPGASGGPGSPTTLAAPVAGVVGPNVRGGPRRARPAP